MKTIGLTDEKLIEQILSAAKAKVIQKPEIGSTHLKNELVFFIKPELLDVPDKTKIQNSMKLIQEMFETFEVQVNGLVILPGTILEKHDIMNRHYGFINQLSRLASEMVDSQTRSKLFEILTIEDNQGHQILGGHEFLKAFDADIPALNRVWFAQEANKLRSGFYFIEDEVNGQPIILINGFHPSQLAHFTQDTHQIVLMLLTTNTDWEAMKFDLVGDTFPERAKPGSIRGQLYQNPEKYGMTEVGINTNGVHLSAGPFEAAFEVVNFFGQILNLDPAKQPPLAIKKAIEAGLNQKQAQSLLENPIMNDEDLFSKTENMNTDQAVEQILNDLK